MQLDCVGHRFAAAAADTLSDFSLLIASGEAHALLGASGAGKSTVLNLVAGILAPSTGSILFDGQEIAQLRPRDRGVAYVFQFPVLYERMSVLENLMFPLRGRRDARDAAQRMAQLLEIDNLGRRPAELTLFEKQIVAIGKAVVRNDVRVLLLDEPLTAVEPGRKWRLRRVLKDIHRQLGVTTIYVTHDQTEALTFADRVTVLHDGVLLQSASPAELVSSPAHEHVGFFIGTPGMNLVPGEAIDAGLEGLVIGFRPEWASFVDPNKPIDPGDTNNRRIVSAAVTQLRPTSVRDGIVQGLAVGALGGTEVTTRQALDIPVGKPCQLVIDRSVRFRDGWRVVA